MTKPDLAGALLDARTGEAALWTAADTRHRRGVLDQLAHAYTAADAAYGRRRGTDLYGGMHERPFAALADLAEVLRLSERRLEEHNQHAQGHPVLATTPLPESVVAMDLEERAAWRRFWEASNRSARAGMLRGELAALTARRAGGDVAAFLILAGWTEQAVSSSSAADHSAPGHS